MEKKVTGRVQFGVCLIVSWVWLAPELSQSASDPGIRMVNSTVDITEDAMVVHPPQLLHHTDTPSPQLLYRLSRHSSQVHPSPENCLLLTKATWPGDAWEVIPSSEGWLTVNVWLIGSSISRCSCSRVACGMNPHLCLDFPPGPQPAFFSPLRISPEGILSMKRFNSNFHLSCISSGFSLRYGMYVLSHSVCPIVHDPMDCSPAAPRPRNFLG